MLVHKATMGVLSYYWTGQYRTNHEGQRLPMLSEYTLAKSGLDPSEWWEVPRNSHLGNALLICYPCCDPVVDDHGELVAIKPWANWADYPERNTGADGPAIIAPSQVIPAEMRRKGQVKGGENPPSSAGADATPFCERGLGAAPKQRRRQKRRSGLFAALLEQKEEGNDMHNSNNYHRGGVPK